MRLLTCPFVSPFLSSFLFHRTQVGDGTTSVVLLACEFLKGAKPFVEDGVHPQIIIRGFRKACKFALDSIRAMMVHVPKEDAPDATIEGFTKRQLLERCASTALNSKLICGQKDLFAPMAVDAVMAIDQDQLDMKMIGIKKVAGGSVTVRDATRLVFADFLFYFSFQFLWNLCISYDLRLSVPHLAFRWSHAIHLWVHVLAFLSLSRRSPSSSRASPSRRPFPTPVSSSSPSRLSTR